ncbi:MAG: AbrB/MazE/SpoVT family DNA-binding domain-containing protein [Candidatus Thermoplasmatota archaeon]|nr:AbrB/MazE/SpoVT family DNA-binding domain-containing protein [Candidatus Thermoplasmatota archaeon]MDD5778955.1 AbrB/MazE/SpoVT family DNA-binding domain-containing protein [Candidatus Thermoplasmatota archaeon]
MKDIAVTTMSCRGQIVIPTRTRKGFRRGDKFIVIRDGDRLIMKHVKNLDKNFEEDLEFARRAGEAFKRYMGGEFREAEGEQFLKILEEW